MEEIYDTIIIGGGPAGITAGVYALRQKLKTLLITKEFGGQITKKAVNICNFPGYEKIEGAVLMGNFVEHLKALNVEIEHGEVSKIEKTDDNFIVETKTGRKIISKTVILSTGAEPKSLNVPGEKEFLGKGVGYCVTCDGPIFRDKTIAVVGGGNAGFESAIFMENYANKIYILEFGKDARADQVNQEIVRNSEKIELITNASVKEIKGEKFVNELIYTDSVSGKEKRLEVQGVFVAVGYAPKTEIAQGLADLNDRKEIKVDFRTLATKTPGFFAAGDVNEGKIKQIIIACGEGCKAALSAYDYISRK